jgi:Undecaprenyl-phosphate glucose phosphotransferase
MRLLADFFPSRDVPPAPELAPELTSELASESWARLDFPDGFSFAEPARRGAHDQRPRISQPLVVGAILLFDLLNFALSGFLAFRLSPGAVNADGLFAASGLAAATPVGILVLQMRWTYTIRALGDFPRQGLSLALAFVAALVAWNGLCVLMGPGEAQQALLRPWSLRWLALGLALGLSGRALFAGLVTRWTREGRLARRTVIVGGGERALETLARLEKSGKGALKILGVFDDRLHARERIEAGGVRLLGAFADLERFCREAKVDLLIVALPPHAEDRLLEVLQQLWALPVDVRISALGGKLPLRDRAYAYIGDVPFLPLFDKPLSDWSIALKSLFDRALAAVLIVVLSPLLALLALGVKGSSPGPVLFVQTRYGFNNRPFGALKFRSMHVASNDAEASRLVQRDDPRVTKFGAFLRRASLDELPQLFNVLKGDLSLVGPRPHAMKAKAAGMIYEQAVEGYFARHRVKPGMTGWAQINGWRGETDTVEKIEQRLAHDLYYIDHWSLWLDLKILARTPLAVLTASNAY